MNTVHLDMEDRVLNARATISLHVIYKQLISISTYVCVCVCARMCGVLNHNKHFIASSNDELSATMLEVYFVKKIPTQYDL